MLSKKASNKTIEREDQNASVLTNSAEETEIHTFGKNTVNQTTKRDENEESKSLPKTPDTNLSRKGK